MLHESCWHYVRMSEGQLSIALMHVAKVSSFRSGSKGCWIFKNVMMAILKFGQDGCLLYLVALKILES